MPFFSMLIDIVGRQLLTQSIEEAILKGLEIYVFPE